MVKGDLLAIFRDLFDGTLNTGPLDYTFICHIPKKEGAKSASNFRSISLINSVQKIISKVLTNRLEGVLKELSPRPSLRFLKDGSFWIPSLLLTRLLVGVRG